MSNLLSITRALYSLKEIPVPLKPAYGNPKELQIDMLLSMGTDFRRNPANILAYSRKPKLQERFRAGYHWDIHQIELGPFDSANLSRFMLNERDDAAVKAGLTLLHEIYHSQSPAHIPDMPTTERDPVEEGLCERKARERLIQLVGFLPKETEYDSQVKILDQIAEYEGEPYIDILWKFSERSARWDMLGDKLESFFEDFNTEGACTCKSLDGLPTLTKQLKDNKLESALVKAGAQLDEIIGIYVEDNGDTYYLNAGDWATRETREAVEHVLGSVEWEAEAPPPRDRDWKLIWPDKRTNHGREL